MADKQLAVTAEEIDAVVGKFSTYRGIVVLESFYADASTSSTDETDLFSYSVPANTLANNGDILKFPVQFDASASPTNVYIKFYFAGSSITWVDSTVSGYGHGTFEIVRVSASVCRVSVYGTGINSSWYAVNKYTEFTSKDWTISNIIKVTGQCATNAIVAKFGYIECKSLA